MAIKFDDIEQEVVSTDKVVSRLSSAFTDNLEPVMNAAADRVISELGKMKFDADGNLINSQANLDFAMSSADRLYQALEQAGYTDLVSTYVGSYDQLVKPAVKMYSQMSADEGMTAPTVADTVNMLHGLQQQDIVQFQGLAQASMDGVKQALYESVLVGQPFSETVAQIREMLAGKQSELMVHAKTYAQDSIMRFQSVLDRQMMSNTGYWYYAGTLIKTSRDFCRKLCGTVLTDEDIKSINQDSWAGQAPGDFRIVRGGYNCRHRLIPIPKSMAEGKGDKLNVKG